MQLETRRYNAWTETMWEILESLPFPAMVKELKAQWEIQCAVAAPVIAIFGGYNSGKSSLLKRILVEHQVCIPEWLSVSGQRETFVANGIEVNGLRFVDTPGIAGGNDDHQLEAFSHLQIADAYLWIMAPQLITGDGDLVVNLLSGKFFADSLPASLVTRSVIAIISRMDNAGTDPEYDHQGYQDRCKAKIEELQSALEKYRVSISSVCCVSADPYGNVGDLPVPTKVDYFPGSENWDGIKELLGKLDSLKNDLPLLRSLAAVRYAALTAQCFLSTLDAELIQRGKAKQISENDRSRYGMWLERLQLLNDQSVASLRAHLRDERTNFETRLFDISRDVVIDFRQSLETFVEDWQSIYSQKLSSLIYEAEAEVELREKSPGVQAFKQLIEGVESIENRDRTKFHGTLLKIMRKIGPSVREGLQNFAEMDVNKNMLDVSKTLAKSAKPSKLSNAIKIIDAVTPALGSAMSLWHEFLAESRENERLNKRRNLVDLFSSVTKELSVESHTAVTEKSEPFRKWLEEHVNILRDAEAVLTSQIDHFSIEKDRIREQLSQLEGLA